MTLASLPVSFASLVPALEARNENGLAFSLDQIKIFDEEQRQKESNNNGKIEEIILQIKKEHILR